ncbi:DNA adenine methylase [Methylomonas sp. HW2-6]|uniref:DNA adenine methylase n=1 Tax=Methylomonas sp. HW2-6 TaxID=3376687 RepID=UPI004043280D
MKWAGGKRWLARQIAELATPINGRYIEPFLGSGAVFFAIQPTQAILSDINADLINTYNAIKLNPKRIFELLLLHHKHHSKEYYYTIREYKPRCEFRMAARFIYLNRTCWNGLYRVNRKGEFNVPIGTKSNVIMETDDWFRLSDILKFTDVVCADFEETIDKAVSGDLIFADPPYTVKHNYNGFIKYNDSLFSWDDQVRLRDSLLRAKSRGVKIFATNAYHTSIHELYQNDFNLDSLTRASVLAGSSSHRGRYEELLIS